MPQPSSIPPPPPPCASFVSNFFQGIGFPSLFLVAVGFVGCDKNAAIILFIFTVGSMGFTNCGFVPNSMDIAPEMAGMLFSLVAPNFRYITMFI
ncbi:unnamed protein product [Protopolystoma xenopodis]|uniref:Uncharacterized protein n=1 Tax=Protopolystoma xenopodis TaxID=117903 RepID=A0A448X9Y0_9PLAT|nr:unnamed protein product [Protopolystoma xenopodis]